MSIEYITLSSFNEPAHHYNLISSSLFILKNMYKSTKEYYDGLKLLVKNYRNFFPGYYFRLYYDDSVVVPMHREESINNEVRTLWIPLIESMKQDKYIQLVKFEAASFKKDGYHDGLLGTVVRFIPTLDLEENKNIDVVIISDIDIDNYAMKNFKDVLYFMKQNNSLFHYNSVNCYPSLPRFDHISDEEIKLFPYPIMAGTIISKIKFPPVIFSDFMTCMKYLDDPKCSPIKNFIEGERKSIYRQMDINIDNDFVYGIDEFILMKYFAKYIIKNNITYSVNVKYDVDRATYMWYLNNIRGKKDSEINPKVKEMLMTLLEDKYDNTKSISENYDTLDNILYNKKRKEELNAMREKLYKLSKQMLKDKNYEEYGFRWRDVNCMSSSSKPIDRERIVMNKK